MPQQSHRSPVNEIQENSRGGVKLVATSDNSAETAVRVLIDEWITKFDIPEVIGSDQGPHFTATVFEGTCKELGIEYARGSPEHPQRQNQLFGNIMALCNRNPASWARAMCSVMLAHNTSVNKTTGMSPYELVFNSKQGAQRHSSCLKYLSAPTWSGHRRTSTRVPLQVRYGRTHKN